MHRSTIKNAIEHKIKIFQEMDFVKFILAVNKLFSVAKRISHITDTEFDGESNHVLFVSQRCMKVLESIFKLSLIYSFF